MVSIAARSRPLLGEVENGDGFLVAVWTSVGVRVDLQTSLAAAGAGASCTVDVPKGGRAVALVVDGVGHGAPAATATRTILDCAKEVGPDPDLEREGQTGTEFVHG